MHKSPAYPTDEVEQGGKGESADRVAVRRPGEQRTENETRVTRQEQSGQALFPSPKGRDQTEMAKSTFQRVACFWNSLTFPPAPTLHFPSFIPGTQRTQGHMPPSGTLGCGHDEQKGMPAPKLRRRSHVRGVDEGPQRGHSNEMPPGAIQLAGSRRSSGRTTSLAGRDVCLPGKDL